MMSNGIESGKDMERNGLEVFEFTILEFGSKKRKNP
jgi:hypothetical protein